MLDRFLRIGFVLSACVLLLAPAARSQVAYGIDTPNDRLIRIELATGAASVVGPLGVDVTAAGMDFDASGTLWAMLTVANVSGTGLYTVDLNTGGVSFVVAVDRNIGGRGCAFVSGTLYHTDGGSLAWVDTGTGVSTVIGNMGFNAPSLASTADGDLYCLKSNPNELVSVDPTNGAGSIIGVSDGASSNLAFDPASEQLFSVSGDDRLVRIDPATGNATEVGLLGIPGATAALAVFSPTVPVTSRTWTEVKSEYRE